MCVRSIVLSMCENVNASILHTDGLEINLFMHYSSMPELLPLHPVYFFLAHFLLLHSLRVPATFPELSYRTMGQNLPVLAITLGLLLTLLADAV